MAGLTIRRACWPLLLLVPWVTGCPSASEPGIKPGPNLRIATLPDNVDTIVDQMVTLINKERAAHNIAPVQKSAALMALADEFAVRMIERDFFAHVDPDTGDGPLQRALKSGSIYLAVGENLAAGQTTPEAVVADWMASTEGHRETILSAQWSEIGVGVRTGGDYGIYWVVEFGNPP